MISCSIVYSKNKEKNYEEAAEELMVLKLNEFLEAILPVCYLICFFVALYRPNAQFVGQFLLVSTGVSNGANPGNVQSS